MFFRKHAESMASTWTMQLQWERWIHPPNTLQANNHQNIRTMGTNPPNDMLPRLALMKALGLKSSGFCWQVLKFLDEHDELWNAKGDGKTRRFLSARLRGNWPSYWSKPSDSSVASVKTKTHPVNSGNRKLNAGERFHILPFGENSSSSIFRIYLLVCGMWITPIDWHLGILHCHNVGSWESSEVSVQKIIRIKPMWWGPRTSSCKSMQNLLSAISCEQILAICRKGSHRVHSVARWWQSVYSLDYPFWPGCDVFSKHTLKRYPRKKLILSWKSWGGRWDDGGHAK